MQKREDAALAAAVQAEHRTPLWELEVDWSGNGTYAEPGADLSDVVDSLGVERSQVGDLPDTSSQADGYITATLEASLSGYREGAEEPISRELNRWNVRGLRKGRPLVAPNVRAAIGLATEAGAGMVRKFTGHVRKVSHDEAAGTVQLDGVDPSERYRKLITLPTYGEFVNHARRRPWAITVNTQWILSHVLRLQGVFASPPFRSDAHLACTGHGGLVAERGFNGAPISINLQGPPKTPLWTEDRNPWGMLASPEGVAGATAVYQEFYGSGTLRFEAGNGYGVSHWLHHGASTGLGASFENRILRVYPTGNDEPRLFVNGFGNGDIYVGMVAANGAIYATPRIALGPEPWRFAGYHWRFVSNTLLRVTVRVDGRTRTWDLTVPATTVPTAPRDGSYLPVVQLDAQCFRAWMLLQGWLNPNPPTDAEWIATSGAGHVAQADIAKGLNEILALPDVANADPWDVMRDAVAAEFGIHGHDETGRYSFRVRSDVRSDVVDVDLDVDANLLGAAYSEDSDSARNVVGFKTTARYHTQDMRTVVKAKDVEEFVVQPGTSTFETEWPHGAAGYQSGILPYCYQEGADTATRDSPYFRKWGTEIVHGWTYSSRGASGGWTILDNSRDVVVRYQQVAARRVQITVTNPGPGPVRLATATVGTQDGEPALRIAGWPLEEEFEHVEEVRDEAAITRHGHERGLDLAPNELRQSPGPVRPLARAILAALVDGPVILEDLPVIGDPRVQPGDVARCHFRDAPDPLLGAVVKVKDAAEDAGYDMDVSVRLLPGQTPDAPTGTLAPEGWTFYLDISRFQGGSPPLDLVKVHALGYGGLVAKIGQGAGKAADGTQFGQTLDAWWTTWRDQGRTLWPNAFAGYWYLGDVETPASQAARCAAAIGDKSIPVMMDWEDGAGSFANLVACIDAFRAAGLLVTMVYCGRGYAAANALSGSSLAGRGVSLISSRYWINDPSGTDPRYAFDDAPAGFGFEPFLGVTPRANQFTQYGRVYDQVLVDVDAFPGTPAALGAMFRGQ